jgi:hypothetical protein
VSSAACRSERPETKAGWCAPSANCAASITAQTGSAGRSRRGCVLTGQGRPPVPLLDNIWVPVGCLRCLIGGTKQHRGADASASGPESRRCPPPPPLHPHPPRPRIKQRQKRVMRRVESRLPPLPLLTVERGPHQARADNCHCLGVRSGTGRQPAPHCGMRADWPCCSQLMVAAAACGLESAAGGETGGRTGRRRVDHRRPR